ncbi:hypothetical protein PVL29_022350 [Vitis rotundifolia]|uniref:Uncharacterized protein n=1 Tax=Vitis rotundifolia TaxID=103349 RepID=A0AA39DBE1_VITRO|nr:hypothetical protein PVL29_022350 [Vitis rotundifolia]
MATRSSQVSREGEATCCHQNGRVIKSFGIKFADQPASQSQPARKRALTAERKRAASCTFFSLSLSILLLSLQNSATHIPFSGTSLSFSKFSKLRASGR